MSSHKADTLVLGLAGCLFLLCTSCEQRSKHTEQEHSDPEARAYWIKTLQVSLERKTHYFNEEIARAERLLDDLKNSVSPLPAQIVVARYLGYDRDNTNQWLLVILWDELRSVCSFRFREYSLQGDEVLCEDYPLYPHGRGREPLLVDCFIPFSTRNHNQRKCLEDWDQYAKDWHEYMRTESGKRDILPTIWIAVPRNDRRVTISLVDLDGQESAAVELGQEYSSVTGGTNGLKGSGVVD